MQKPTKAQKRREQRAAEEAEREARIEAEKASIGPDSKKDKEAAELDNLLEPLGLTIKDIPVRLLAVHLQLQHAEDQHICLELNAFFVPISSQLCHSRGKHQK